MNKAIFRVLIGSALLAMAATAQAREVDESIDAASDGHVEIINISGSVEVYGWSRDTVEVKGELGAKVEELILERNGDRVLVKVELAAAQAIERVQTTDRVVLLQDTDALIKVRQPDPGRQPAHPSTDNDRVVLRFHGVYLQGRIVVGPSTTASRSESRQEIRLRSFRKP